MISESSPGGTSTSRFSAVAAPAGRSLRSKLSASDLVFRAVARAGGVFVLVLMLLVGSFLAFRALNALHKAGWSFLTTQAWNPDSNDFGIVAILVGTILIAFVAIIVALPLATGAALYISEYAPRQIKPLLIGVIDLMAAVPSIVYGMWGWGFLQWKMASLARWINDWFFWIPLFKVDGVTRHYSAGQTATFYTSSSFMAGVVVALMVMPIACSIMRQAFSQAPPGEREGAYALGSTRWGMIRAVVIPFGLGAMIGGTMLGLGRALGETIAVALIISPVFLVQPHILQSGGSSIASLIALRYAESTPFGVSALFAAGLALFGLTLSVNFVAAVIVSRSRSGAVSDA
ncbi:MAG TPA: phosphate ABC transporter permease subunit PstC [Streptosporangiaceae bacterium]|nr:phosphate ABC transporter permease subunit PstC [Streptosporangiaceae bacterium]